MSISWAICPSWYPILSISYKPFHDRERSDLPSKTAPFRRKDNSFPIGKWRKRLQTTVPILPHIYSLLQTVTSCYTFISCKKLLPLQNWDNVMSPSFSIINCQLFNRVCIRSFRTLGLQSRGAQYHVPVGLYLSVLLDAFNTLSLLRNTPGERLWRRGLTWHPPHWNVLFISITLKWLKFFPEFE